MIAISQIPKKWLKSTRRWSHFAWRPTLVVWIVALSPAAAQKKNDPAWDSTAEAKWPPPFEIVRIPSSLDGSQQLAYAYHSEMEGPRPLVVSLHTWSGSYQQIDPLAAKMKDASFHYIHPDFRGPNRTPESCASPLALRDIDDAISYCLENWNVDRERIYMIGGSGGAHAVCSAYFNSKHPIAAFFAWMPITDLPAWHLQCKQRGLKYAKDIEKICGGKFDLATAKARSPLHMQVPSRRAPLHLYAGINDGYNGSVPITHSIFLYNKLAEEADRVSDEEIIRLVSKTVAPTDRKIGNRVIYRHSESSRSSLTIFEGGHEMLVDVAVDNLLREANANPSTGKEE